MNDKHLEDNVRKLLSSTEPELEMPRRSKERVLSKLKGRAAKPKTVPGRPLSWATAAAAAAVLLFLLFWPGGMDGGLAWADVVKHFNNVESLIARLTLEEMPPSGVAMVTTGRLYQMDPGKSRSEIFTTTSDEPESIVITKSGVGYSSILRLTPHEKVAHRTRLFFSGAVIEERERMSRDIVAETWARLERVTADQADVFGEGDVDGVPVVGFEVDIKEVFKVPRVAGVMRVWAERDSGVPLEVEAEFLDPGGVMRRTTFSDIEWNAPLAEELFEAPDLYGWQVVEEEIREVGFTRTTLRKGVTLRLGLGLLTEDDIEAVHSGTMVKSSDRHWPRLQVGMKIKPDAAERLRSYTAEHRGEWVTCDFNGEFDYQIRIGGTIGEELTLDITVLGKTLEQFEEEYLM